MSRLMDNHEIIHALDAFIRMDLLGNQHKEPIQPEEELLKTGMVDSIGFFKLLAFIEERFGVTYGDEELVPDNFRTLKTIVKRIAQKQAQHT